MHSEPIEWDEKSEHENDLRWESRQDDESWNVDEPDDPEPADEVYREHMRRMLNHGLDWINDNASGTTCEHKYAEQETAPLGVKCVRCGHFVGAHE